MVLEEALAGVRRALKEARETIVKMVERGEYGVAIEALATTLERAFSRLGDVVMRFIEQLGEKTDKLHESVVELRKGLEEERALRQSVEGRVGHLEERMVEAELRISLTFWCDRYGLGFERLPSEPFRVDGVIIGERLVALIEIAKTGAEADIEQLLEGARIYEQIRGEKPNALALFIYAEKPPEWLIEEAGKHGIIVDNSPRRIARALARIEEELKRKREERK